MEQNTAPTELRVAEQNGAGIPDGPDREFREQPERYEPAAGRGLDFGHAGGCG
ncbi:hypothetical protein ACFVUY_09935 [Kitasatospora sp. NPDC058063]|uniref:hypothetical protein n=1 Tax=unclassified Kitasatospora TaxID=2633591 RepID=UPI00343F62F3